MCDLTCKRTNGGEPFDAALFLCHFFDAREIVKDQNRTG